MSMPLAFAAILAFGVVPQSAGVLPPGQAGEPTSNQPFVHGSPDWFAPVQKIDGSRRSRNPYENLFAPAHQSPPLFVPPAGPAAKSEPIVKCAIVVVPADPSVDPGIMVRPPDDNVDFKIRRITPEPCKT